MKTVFLVHLVSTLGMVGVIWVIQWVHYPLFAGVGTEGWVPYAAQHQSRITLIVGPLMLAELTTAVWLVLDRPAAFPLWAVVLGAALVGVIWLTTAALSVPAHNALSAAFDADAHAWLVATNWIRTVAWTVRGGLAVWLASRVLPPL